ncbi:hypothetical protein ACQVP2_11830 [Methylobacterium aquaticum]|uniref:hypothetical protein n=1 Tax=Methylobacterium aquaticum TaxID=270351 RepID=UPI003D1679FF
MAREPTVPPSRLALAGQRFARLGSCFVADFYRRTGDHFGDICLEHFPTKWTPVGRRKCGKIKNLEHCPIAA